jgi:hypothetical protein
MVNNELSILQIESEMKSIEIQDAPQLSENEAEQVKSYFAKMIFTIEQMSPNQHNSANDYPT